MRSHLSSIQYGLSILFIALLFVQPLTRAQQLWSTYNTSNSEIGGNTILAIATDSKNRKWVGTNLGLCRLQGRTWTDYAMFNKKLKDQFVNCLTVDRKGNLWIGTDDFGAITFDGVRWDEHSSQLKELNMRFIRAITEDRRGSVWIGVTLGGVVRYDGTDWKKFTQSDSKLSSDFVLCITVDNNNNKWIGTNDGLCMFDDRNWIIYNTANSNLPHNIVPAIVVDESNVKWFGTLGGLVRFDGTNWQTFSADNSPLPDNQINGMVIDKGGILWIATNKGVTLYDRKGHWKVLTPTNSTMPQAVVQCIAIDEQGNKWFGTDFKGLVSLAGHIVAGKIVDEAGRPQKGMVVSAGRAQTTTDADGRYSLEVPSGESVTVSVQSDGREVAPSNHHWDVMTASALGQNFTISNSLQAQGKSTERVVVTPYLDQGYITISTESETAEVEFVSSSGKSVRTVQSYRSGNKITISKMPKDTYILKIRTARGEKQLRFSLK